MSGADNEKTKEIVERLRTEADNQYSKIAHDLMVEAADLITRLSERVGELERLSGERCMAEHETQCAVSQQQDHPLVRAIKESEALADDIGVSQVTDVMRGDKQEER